MQEKRKFELETTRKDGRLVIKNYESTLELAKEKCEEYPAFIIQNEQDYKEMKDKRALFNNAVKSLDRRRIDETNEFVGEYVEQAKNIAKVFKDHSAKIDAEIKAYEKKTKDNSVESAKTFKPIKYTATIECYDKNIIDELKEFCEKKNCSIVVGIEK